MSANNYLAVRTTPEKLTEKNWFVMTGDADSANERILSSHSTRDEAIDAAVKEFHDGYVEYGINYIEPKENLD